MREGKAALMRIYTDERARSDDGPLFTAIVERARKSGIAGATVLRAVAGFGESKSVQRASILDLSGNLPLIVELVDDIQALRGFTNQLAGLPDIGLVTIEKIEVLHYGGAKPVGEARTP